MPKGHYDRTKRAPSIPSIAEICKLVPDEESALSFLTSRGVLAAPRAAVCCVCGYRGCRAKSKRTPKVLKCNKCDKTQSLLRGTIFAKTKVPLHHVVYLLVFWLYESPVGVAKNQLHCSDDTVSDFYGLFRQMAAKMIASNRNLVQGWGQGLDENAAVSMWRGNNANNLWDAFLQDLGTLTYFKDRGFELKGNVHPSNVGFDARTGPAVDPYANYAQGGSEQANTQQIQPAQNEVCGQSVDRSFQASAVAGQRMDGPFAENEITRVATETADALSGIRVIEHWQPQNPEMSVTQQRQTPKKGLKRPHSLSALGEVATGDQKEVEARPGEKRKSPKQSRKEIPSVPSFLDISRQIPTEDAAIQFLVAKGVFPDPKGIICTHCGYVGFRVKGKKTPKAIKCNRCSKGSSLMKGTFFEGVRAPLQQVLQMAVLWLSMSPATTMIAQLRCSSATVADVSTKFRRLIKQYMEQTQGISDVAVQSDENKDRLKPHMPKFARKQALDEHVCVASWREANAKNLWEAFLLALSTVKKHGAQSAARDEPWVDETSGKACCKYHKRLNSMEHSQGEQQQEPIRDVGLPALPPHHVNETQEEGNGHVAASAPMRP